jgi:hypothetical protein
VSIVLISDLHLTQTPRDEYRWRIFPQLEAAENISDLFILGDLTDAKDYHSARLVNRLVLSFVDLKKRIRNIWLLRGNHDGTDPRCPYFEFLQYVDIKYVSAPFEFDHDALGRVLLLPHSREPLEQWRDVDMHQADFIFMHATITGAQAENGQSLDGVPITALATARRAKIFSGDVHVPQKVGKVEYVGAPYPIRFGDSFKGRWIEFRQKAKGGALEAHSVPLDNIQRLKMVVGVDGPKLSKAFMDVGKGDQVKVVVQLDSADFGRWQEIKDATMKGLESLGAECCGFELQRLDSGKPLATVAERKGVVGRTPEQVLNDWCKTNKLTAPIRDMGMSILKGTK